MTTQNFFRSLFAMTLIVFTSQFANAQKREIKEGEPIMLEIQNDGDIDKLEIGNQITFRTTTNVIVEGKEVIRAFSSAVGTVLEKSNSGYNTGASIKVEVRHIRAVDGSQVLVTGPINLTNLNIHTPTTVYVKNPLIVEVR
jgi:hypothetical protein